MNTKTIKDYYEHELRTLNESASTFARQYPEIAGQLNLSDFKDRDPYVERLLEGTAFLTGQIHQRLDASLPEISETLLQQLWPQILRPYPSHTIMQFNPKPNQITQTKLLPAHTQVASKPAGPYQQKMIFQTIAPLLVHPLTITDIQIESESYLSKWRFQFTTCPNTYLADLNLSSLVFYLRADASAALECIYALLAKTQSISLVSSTLAPHLSFHPVFYNGENRQGFDLLLNYFNFREQYYFIELKGLEKRLFEPAQTQFEIVVLSDYQFAETQKIKPEMFQLNCVPAINLFSMDAEPIAYHKKTNHYPVHLSYEQNEGLSLYQINEIHYQSNDKDTSVCITPLTEFEPQAKKNYYYHTSSRFLGNSKKETCLHICDDENLMPGILSLNITACQENFPREHLQPLMITQWLNHKTHAIEPVNLLRPSRMLLPPAHRLSQWTLLGLMGLNFQSVMNLKTLKTCLDLFNFSQSDENHTLIEAIEKIEYRPENHIHRGALLNGIHITLTVQEKNFLSTAHVYHFGLVLMAFFQEFVLLNHFLNLTLETTSSHLRFTWKKYSGRKPLI